MYSTYVCNYICISIFQLGWSNFNWIVCWTSKWDRWFATNSLWIKNPNSSTWCFSWAFRLSSWSQSAEITKSYSRLLLSICSVSRIKSRKRTKCVFTGMCNSTYCSLTLSTVKSYPSQVVNASYLFSSLFLRSFYLTLQHNSYISHKSL